MMRPIPEDASDRSRRVRYWGRIFVINCLATIVVSAAGGVFSGRAPVSEMVFRVLANFIFSNSIGGLIGLSLPPIVGRLWALQFPGNWIALVGALLAINGAGCMLAMLVIAALRMAPFDRVLPGFWDSYKFAVLFTVVFGIGGTLYELIHLQLEGTTHALRAKHRDEERARQAATRARLSSLESRVRPHFLFNTLNAISALVHDDPDRAERLIERLSGLLRASLDASGQPTVPLNEELQLVRDYLDIERTRFGDRLGYTVDVPGSLAAASVPPFSIQPLVENAVKYAVAARPSGATISIEARREGDTLIVAISDDGGGFESVTLVPGHGLHTLHARLEVLFGSSAGLHIGREADRTVVTLRMPFHISTSSAA
jgi:hypothetical protein